MQLGVYKNWIKYLIPCMKSINLRGFYTLRMWTNNINIKHTITNSYFIYCESLSQMNSFSKWDAQLQSIATYNSWKLIIQRKNNRRKWFHFTKSFVKFGAEYFSKNDLAQIELSQRHKLYYICIPLATTTTIGLDYNHTLNWNTIILIHCIKPSYDFHHCRQSHLY